MEFVSMAVTKDQKMTLDAGIEQLFLHELGKIFS